MDREEVMAVMEVDPRYGYSEENRHLAVTVMTPKLGPDGSPLVTESGKPRYDCVYDGSSQERALAVAARLEAEGREVRVVGVYYATSLGF